MYSKNPLINLLKYTWHYSFGTKKWLVIFVILSTIGRTIYLLQPLVIGRIFNMIQFSEQKDQMTFITYGLILLVILFVLSWIFHGTARVIENRNAFLVRKNYRQAMFEKVMDLPTSWHKDHHSGDTIDKINKAGDHLYDFSSAIFLIIQNIVGLVASVIILSFFDMKPIAIILFSAVAAISIITKLDKKLIRNYDIINKNENYVAAGIYDYISNYLTIISLRLKKQSADEMDQRSMKAFFTAIKTYKINEIKWFSSGLIISVMASVVIFFNAYGSYRSGNVIAIGTLFILYQYLTRIGDTFYAFTQKYGDIVRQNSALVGAAPIIEEHGKLKSEKQHDIPTDWKTLQIKKLDFTYKETSGKNNRECSLRDIAAHIGQKEKIALIGSSGSGKSTFLSLLRGLHEADRAEVYCDGKKLVGGLRHIREHCTLIPQDPEIFNNTIGYNITLGVRVSKTMIKKVIQLVNLDEFVSRLPKGLKTNVLEKGVSLSGGEKQRLALARGLLAASDSQILLMDEPTSSVDVENELEIYQNIFSAYSDKTIVVAIHSLHLLRHFDNIYMFKEGRMVAEGSFTEILEDENFKLLWDNYDTEKNS